MKGSTASAPDTPDWLKEPDLAPPTPKPTPDWLKGPNPAPPAPRPTQPPAPQGSLPSIRTSAALPTAAPTFNVQRAPAQRAVPMRPTPLAAPTLAGNALTLAAGMAGLLGVLVAAANPALAIILFVVMVGLGGKRLGHAAAQGVGAVIDWLWQDPVLRRRLLGE